MSDQRAGWWGLGFVVTGALLLVFPGVVLELAFTLLDKWMGSDPARMENVGYCSVDGSWLLGLVLLIAALCFGWRSRQTLIGTLTTTLSATGLVGIATFVGYFFWRLCH